MVSGVPNTKIAGPPDGDPGSPGSVGYGGFHNPSIGVGSAYLFDESMIYKAKDLSLIKIETTPVDAAQFRGWKNAFLTKASSIDIRQGKARYFSG